MRKQQLLQRAVNKIARGSLARAFLAWKDKFAIVDKFLLMKRKGIAVNRMGRMRRAFKEWRVLVNERWWKDQMITRDNDIERLNRLVSCGLTPVIHPSLSVSLPLSLSLSLSLSVSVCLSVCLSLSIYLSIYLYLSISVSLPPLSPYLSPPLCLCVYVSGLDQDGRKHELT